MEAVKSRRGFHPCPYETYLKLKTLKKRFWETVFDYSRWRRWACKLENNRVGPEPKFCPFFLSQDAKLYSGAVHWQKRLSDDGFLKLLNEVRMPSPTEIEGLHPLTIRRIDEAYEKVEEWFSR